MLDNIFERMQMMKRERTRMMSSSVNKTCSVVFVVMAILVMSVQPVMSLPGNAISVTTNITGTVADITTSSSTTNIPTSSTTISTDPTTTTAKITTSSSTTNIPTSSTTISTDPTTTTAKITTSSSLVNKTSESATRKTDSLIRTKSPTVNLESESPEKVDSESATVLNKTVKGEALLNTTLRVETEKEDQRKGKPDEETELTDVETDTTTKESEEETKETHITTPGSISVTKPTQQNTTNESEDGTEETHITPASISATKPTQQNTTNESKETKETHITPASISVTKPTQQNITNDSEEGTEETHITTPGPISVTKQTQFVQESYGIRFDTIPGYLVKCKCGGDEVLTAQGCQKYDSRLFIYGDGDDFEPELVPVQNQKVVVYQPKCKEGDGHRVMNFTGDQFYLRLRGDIVLKGDEDWNMFGLRINNYCVTHSLDQNGNVEWWMKACLPPPSVPRCCPPGEAMGGGEKCQPAKSPKLLTPPLSADIFQPAVPWPVITNHVNRINCTEDPVASFPVDDHRQTTLLHVPTGMIHIWTPPPSISYTSKKYTYPDDFCVDGIETEEGSVEYTVKQCYTDPVEKHNKECYGHMCIRKCCDYGQVMSTSLTKCVDHENVTFKPPFIAEPLSYKVVIGKPLCVPQTSEMNVSIDARGKLHLNGRQFEAIKYCSDLFTDGSGKLEDGVLVCLTSLTTWDKVREIAFPLCQMISLIFLALTLLCHYFIPALLQRGGWFQVFHMASLMVAYSSGFTQSFRHNWDDPTCIAMASMMQFGYLCAFFWLSVLCFEAWRSIRSLSRLLPPHKKPLWAYTLFGFGIPLAICVLTLCMQFLVPEDVPYGVVKPRLAESQCWFPDTLELLLYFYGPIALLFFFNILFMILTYCTYRHIEKNSALKKEHTHRKKDYVANFKQQVSLLALSSICWVTELLSWKIHPPELWALTDILNTLQGFFVFVIFVSNETKRRQLERKFPKVFRAIDKVSTKIGNAIKNLRCLSVGELFSIKRKISASSIVSSVSSRIHSSFKVTSSTSSFYLTSKDETTATPRRSSSISDSDVGIVVLSHAPLSQSQSDSKHKEEHEITT